MAGISVINLADIYGKAQQYRANEQAMQLQDMQMQQAMQNMQKQKTLRDLVASSYTPPSAAVPFETDEEAFMGQPSLSGLTAKPAVRGGMNYDRLAQGLAGMGDYEGMAKVEAAQTDRSTKLSTAHQKKIETAQKFVDAGDAMGLQQFVLADDETPDDVKVSVNKDGSMTLTSASWPEPRTLGMSREMTDTLSKSRYRDKTTPVSGSKQNAIQAKIAAINSLDLDPDEKERAILAITGAATKVGGRDTAQMDAIAAYKAQYPMNPLTGKQPPGAPTFEQFMQSRGAAKPGVNPEAQAKRQMILQANPGRSENDPEIQALFKKYGI